MRVGRSSAITPLRWVAVLCSGLALTGCSTFHELTTPGETTRGYVETRNSQGETVYRRERVVSPLAAPAEPDPRSGTSPSLLNPSEPMGVAPTATNASGQAPAEEGRADAFFSAELAAAKGYGQIGIAIGKETWSFMDLRGGVSLFFGSETYAGFDLGARAKMKFGLLSPFVGLGGYLGDTKSCSTQNFVETCDKKFLSAAFTEVGVFIWALTLFYRNYSIEEAGRKVPTTYSIGLGYTHRF